MVMGSNSYPFSPPLTLTLLTLTDLLQLRALERERPGPVLPAVLPVPLGQLQGLHHR